MCNSLLILAEVATKELITNYPQWKFLRSSLQREKAVCGKKNGSYRKMLSYEKGYPDYKKMQEIFNKANELILSI